eukprot:CAMPEP_0180648226 /NCGR_PEP_ID=MMETSP1037_2-20121125/50839_1 /TAXON_ID=632150 /ORGANISM="Azadinium spinosum, Strain 3D9" /LENGTH=38 /DNA_ID= /DNA_START= /DNA_END= /DNA_ORIENTATION=
MVFGVREHPYLNSWVPAWVGRDPDPGPVMCQACVDSAV